MGENEGGETRSGGKRKWRRGQGRNKEGVEGGKVEKGEEGGREEEKDGKKRLSP